MSVHLSTLCAQTSRATGKPSYDSVGSSRRIHHRRKARTTRPPRPSLRLPSVPLRELLPTTKRASGSLSRVLLQRLPFPTISFPQPHLTREFHVSQIYGFMRKVNLRNVDPAIDDPDASTWCKCRDVSVARSRPFFDACLLPSRF